MSLDGTYNVTINSPMGAQEAVLTLAASGDALTGSLNGAAGEQSFTGTAEGNTAKFSVDITQPMPLTLEFTTTVDGDAVSGDVKLGAFGNASLTGTRTA